jgi:hypothetical protein
VTLVFTTSVLEAMSSTGNRLAGRRRRKGLQYQLNRTGNQMSPIHKKQEMNIAGLLADLRTRKQQIEHVIALLEELQPQAAPGSRRGRKSMGQKEREEVSVRMSKYWANRRMKAVARTAGDAPGVKSAFSGAE